MLYQSCENVFCLKHVDVQNRKTKWCSSTIRGRTHFGRKNAKSVQNVSKKVTKMCQQSKYVQNVPKTCPNLLIMSKKHPNSCHLFGHFQHCKPNVSKIYECVKNVSIMCPNLAWQHWVTQVNSKHFLLLKFTPATGKLMILLKLKIHNTSGDLLGT